MKIEVGKTYRTRDGSIAKITGKRDHDGHPFFASVTDGDGRVTQQAYATDGSYFHSGHPFYLDLVEEINDWIEWTGGDRPVPAHTKVITRLRNGYTETIPTRASVYRWSHLDVDDDIVAYKIVDEAAPEPVQPPPPPPSPLTKRDILNEAIEVVGSRGKSYGKPEDNFNRIARLWEAHLENRYGDDYDVPPIDTQDVSMMMVLMKVARLENDPNHHDSWVDTAGYAACGGELAARNRT